MKNWDSLRQRAQALEALLDSKIKKYSQLAQKVNDDLLCDEENAMFESQREQELAADIEDNLSELQKCINSMRASPSLSTQDNLVIKRYTDIHFYSRAEFRNTVESVNSKRESMELFRAKKSPKKLTEENSATSRLLGERSGIESSRRGIEDILSQAAETKSILESQRAAFLRTTNYLQRLVMNVPSFNSLISGIQKKKDKDAMIITVLIAILICFTLWWVFLR